jgi:hypothetical protein
VVFANVKDVDIMAILSWTTSKVVHGHIIASPGKEKKEDNFYIWTLSMYNLCQKSKHFTILVKGI